jgi:large subunit ribosomal protein L18
MMIKRETSKQRHRKRHLRVRVQIKGTPQRPRLNVFRSLSHIYVQVIDDTIGHTLTSASSLESEVRESGAKKADRARLVGKIVARRALEKGINQVVFDRGGYRYHGRIKVLAEAARESGLKF